MSDPITRITTEAAPSPAGHYSQATAWNGLVFASGQLGVRPDGTHSFDASFEEQARQAIENVLAVLRAAGCGPEGILRVTAYIVGADKWPEFNQIYASMFDGVKPARTVVPVPELHHGYLVEIDAIGVRGAS
ncbi:reactive intermediate/imine deaminase [Novosphingobium chloroacetimidivorans]|uniref:Reactive intermediate/imine deaminase n=1 Tax=Novosphingobium chloroacetimidivorans TaxID=1428314 RepID=A0A7W7KB07_9SPHN|nr:RidA family protein [Novosphingobium chloroacetimidivorans]MBB4859275.1 reactive intermediate/imine deaminase [Novosphingobium chloroacetimidivorans]